MPNRSNSNTSTWVGNWSEMSLNTPNFRKKVETGQLLPDNNYRWSRNDYFSTPEMTYSGLRTELQASGLESLVGRLSNGYWTQSAGGAKFGYGLTSEVLHQILRNKLNQRLWEAPIDLGVSLGEYRETANLVAGSMVEAARLYRGIRKHPFALAKKYVKKLTHPDVPAAAKAAANAWLGYSYAVKPLMQDCYGAVKALTDGLGADVPVHIVRVSQKEDAGGYNSHSPTSTHRRDISIVGQMKGSGRMIFYVDNPFTFTLDQLGVLNPFSLAWELIPFSFVVDWFLPVGDMLRSVVPPQGVKFAKAYTYVKTEVSWDRRTMITSPAPGWNTKGFGKLVYKERKALSTFPRFEYVSPDLSPSQNQLASAASLLMQLL